MKPQDWLKLKIEEIGEDIKHDQEVLAADLTSLENLCKMHKKRIAAGKPVEGVLAGQLVQKIDARIVSMENKRDFLKQLQALLV